MQNKSFTLIELLVVIVIIGILAGVIIVSVSSSISKASIAKLKVSENNIQNELGANMVSRWKLDEIIGTTTPDAWGINTGNLINSPISKDENECVSGSCLAFNGTSTYVDCGDLSNYIRNNNITFSLWVKPLITGVDGAWSYSFSAFMGKAGSGSSGDLHVGYRSDNKVRVYFESLAGGTYFDSVNPINLNKWSYVVVSTNSSKVSLYIDGTLSASKSFATNFAINNMRIGHTLYAAYFNGLIDDVRIYNEALSSAQIKQQYVAGLDSLLASGNVSKEEYNQKLNALAYAE